MDDGRLQLNCTNPAFYWASNSVGQNPCEVAISLEGTCTANATHHTLGRPNAMDQDSCRCSTVVYSVIAACAACQDADVAQWSNWSDECATVYTMSLPGTIPNGTAVPAWAFFDVRVGDRFDANLAEANATADPRPLDSTAIPQQTASTTDSLSTLPAPSASVITSSASPISASSSQKVSNIGAIAGGVIGGVVFLALAAALVLWFLKRRQRSRTAPSAAYLAALNDSHYQAPPIVRRSETQFSGASFRDSKLFPQEKSPFGLPSTNSEYNPYYSPVSVDPDVDRHGLHQADIHDVR